MNAPRSCPKSSASTSDGETVVQSNTTNGPWLPPISWSDSASTSLPVPVSPSMMTGTRLDAMRSQSG